MCEPTLQFLLAWTSEAISGWLHTVAVVLKKERPVAGVDGRRRGLWLDGVGVGVGLHKSHCVDFRRTWWLHLPSCRAHNFLAGAKNFLRGPCAC